MRIALKLAYLGTGYHGFQVQPGIRTIEGELFRALRELNIINNPHEASYGAAGRTDKGVHALGQVVAFNTDNPDVAIPRAINSRLENIWAWARAEVSSGFDPRRDAKYREYRYVMHGSYDLSLLQKASRLFNGIHDFSNFATPDKGRTSACEIQEMDIHGKNDFTIIDIRANYFLWHMVRKMAAAMKMVGSGARDMQWLEKMLNPSQFTEGLEPAPAYGLVLRNVEYENVAWDVDAYARKSMLASLDEQFLMHGVMAEVLKGFMEV